MNRNRLETWLRAYGRAWETLDPDAAASLFTEDARYYETPWGAPALGRTGVRAYWADASVVSNWRSVDFSASNRSPSSLPEA